MNLTYICLCCYGFICKYMSNVKVLLLYMNSKKQAGKPFKRANALSAFEFKNNFQLSMSLEKYQILPEEFLNTLEHQNSEYEADESNRNPFEETSTINKPLKQREVSFLNTTDNNKKKKTLSKLVIHIYKLIIKKIGARKVCDLCSHKM